MREVLRQVHTHHVLRDDSTWLLWSAARETRIITALEVGEARLLDSAGDDAAGNLEDSVGIGRGLERRGDGEVAEGRDVRVVDLGWGRGCGYGHGYGWRDLRCRKQALKDAAGVSRNVVAGLGVRGRGRRLRCRARSPGPRDIAHLVGQERRINDDLTRLGEQLEVAEADTALDVRLRAE